jgi:hypothetical protein
MKRGLGTAIDYLKSFYPIEMIPEDLQKRAGLDILVHTLSHSLRRARRTGEVLVKYYPDNSGQKIATYSWNPDYTPRPSKVKAKAVKPPQLYFYALNEAPHIFSPYYTSKESIMAAVNTCAYKMYSGTHESPVAL